VDDCVNLWPCQCCGEAKETKKQIMFHEWTAHGIAIIEDKKEENEQFADKR
jgi:hypothetical protein